MQPLTRLSMCAVASAACCVAVSAEDVAIQDLTPMASRQEAFDWYTREFNLMVKQIDTSLPAAKQLQMLDKAGDALRKAAERSLIDQDAVLEFAERVFKPNVAQLKQKLQAELGITGDALEAKALEAMRKPAIGCFVAGTLVHTKEGLKPIEQIKVGDWVLSRPENPEQGTETGYKRVTKTFRFEGKEVVQFTWHHHLGNFEGEFDNVFVTPNHPVWSYPHGWVAMGRMYDLNKRIEGTILRGEGGYDEWFGRDLVLFDGSAGERYDVFDLYSTDKQYIPFKQEDDWGLGRLLDLSVTPYQVIEDTHYDYDKWGDPVNETRERYSTTVYNIEVEDWHTYFVGKTGLWVHNTNCVDADLVVKSTLDSVDDLIRDAVQMGSQGAMFNKLTRAELNLFLKNNPEKRDGFAIIRMDGASKYDHLELGDDLLPNFLRQEDNGPGRMFDKLTGIRHEFAVLINPNSWAGQQFGAHRKGSGLVLQHPIKKLN